MKGIPHPSKSWLYHDPLKIVLDAPASRLFTQMREFLIDPTHAPIPCKVIGTRFYMYRSLVDVDVYCAKHINYDIIEKLMEKKGELLAYYGGMKRAFHYFNGDILLVKPDVVSRMVCRTDWWDKGKRIYAPDANACDPSFPPGYDIENYLKTFI